MTADDTVTAKLAEWEALTGAATEGPWAPWLDQDGAKHMQGRLMVGNADAVIPDGETWIEGVDVNPIAECYTPEDRAFIAAARQMVPALLGFVREVRKGHEPEPEARAFDPLCCARCREEWPCPTEQAARKWVGGEG